MKRAWLYFRLSRDEDQEQNSLQNQRQILVDYAEKNGYKVVGESFDDNVTGMTFERDGILKIEEAVDKGMIDTVLVKDMSRLGRHRTQTALFLDYLTGNNVNMISVTEGIDSFNENDDLIIGLKQIVNDLYCKDISRKVTAGVRQKQKDKGLIETLPMGYYKDKNNNKVCIDEEAAEIIREIYALYIEGYGMTAIAKKLNARGVRSPEFYMRRRIADWKPDISKRYLWVQTAIKRILNNELYIGVMVNHKTISNKIRKTKSAVPAEERFRHTNFCEPIIEESVWNQVQYLLKERAENKARAASGRRIHRYCGIIKCAECGASLIAQKRRWNGNEYVEYSCNSNHRYGKKYCTPHRVRESQLDELVMFELTGLHDHILAEADKYDNIVKEWNKKKPLYEQQIKQHETKISGLKREIEELIIDRMNDREHSDLYNKMIADREVQIKELEKKITECRVFDRISKEKHKQLKKTSEVIEDILSEGAITDSQLRMLVRKVKVHQNGDGTLDIEFEMNGSWNGSYAIMLVNDKPCTPLWNENPPPEFYEAMLQEDLERERNGTLLPCTEHPPEIDDDCYDAMLEEEEKWIEENGGLEMLEKRYHAGEDD